MLQRVGFDGRRRVIKSVCVVRGLSGQRARVGQRSCPTVAEEPARTRRAEVTTACEEEHSCEWAEPTAYRSCRINSTSWPWWHFLMQLTQMAFLSVVLQVWHLGKHQTAPSQQSKVVLMWQEMNNKVLRPDSGRHQTGGGGGTCRSHAWGNWCSWRSCRDTVLC